MAIASWCIDQTDVARKNSRVGRRPCYEYIASLIPCAQFIKYIADLIVIRIPRRLLV